MSLFFLSLFFSFFLFPLVIFLHILLFGDGIQFWKLRQQGYEVITCTLGEFDEGLRASTTSPAIQIWLHGFKTDSTEALPGIL